MKSLTEDGSKRDTEERRRGRLFPRLLLATVPIMLLLTISPAFAGHRLEITHVPPNAAMAGTDVNLLVVVRSDCGGLGSDCDPIILRAYYQASGEMKSVAREIPSSGGTASITIPGVDVREPALKYWLVAEQKLCHGSSSCHPACHTVTGRAPESGMFRVTVHPSPVDERLIDSSASESPDQTKVEEPHFSLDRAGDLVATTLHRTQRLLDPGPARRALDGNASLERRAR